MNNNKEIDISVCIANYNGVDIIEACVNSVLAQTGPQKTEIIIHDDCSSDDSIALIREKYPSIKLIPSNENVGYCIGNNRMVDAASGKYILLLNNDAELFSDALQTFFTHSRKIRDSEILTIPQYSKSSNELLDKGMFLDVFSNPIPNLRPGTREVATVMGACLWTTKLLWAEIGGFPTWFESIGEDLYLCCAARLLGKQVMILDSSGYYHRVGHSFGGGAVKDKKLHSSYKRRRLSERNKSFVILIFWPNPWVFPVFTLHCAILLLEGMTLSLIKFEPKIFHHIYLHALTECYRNRKLISSHRRRIQVGKQAKASKFLSLMSLLPQKLRLLFRHGLPSIK